MDGTDGRTPDRRSAYYARSVDNGGGWDIADYTMHARLHALIGRVPLSHRDRRLCVVAMIVVVALLTDVC